LRKSDCWLGDWNEVRLGKCGNREEWGGCVCQVEALQNSFIPLCSAMGFCR